MKITINTEVLKERHLSFGDFLVLLIGYYDLSYKETLQKLIRDGTVQPNVFNKDEMVLSDICNEEWINSCVRIILLHNTKSIDRISLWAIKVNCSRCGAVTIIAHKKIHSNTLY